jgi:hypothetical protein
MWIKKQQPRIFRGRGGATDRRLPKHGARRRRKSLNHTNDHHDESVDQKENDNESDESLSHSLSHESPAVKNTEEYDEDIVEIVDNIDDKKCGYDRINSFNSSSIDESKEEPPPSPPPPYLVEIKHLKQRIINVQEISIQTSRDAIASDLAKYQNNVLNATQNCANEWRAIARHYNTISNNDSNSDGDHDNDVDNDNDGDNDDDMCISSALRTEVGLAVFQLIQLSVQSGPLSGGKPGYFKRCGVEVAKVVLDFLEEAVPQHDALGIDCMGFTSKQMDAMKKWKVNAGKAVENDKPPSKSVMKKMQKNDQQQKRTKKKKKT